MNSEPSASRRLETYLDQLLVPLARNLSDFHRGELRRELRAHLWERVSAYQELGMAEDGAITEALRQFGGAENFARQWRQEWLRKPSKMTLREVYEAGRLALRPTLIGLAAASLPFGLLAGAVSHLHYPLSQTEGIIGTTTLWILLAFAVVVSPLAVGIRQGRQTPRQAGIGMLVALSAEGLTAALVYQTVGLLWPGWTAADNIFAFVLFLVAAWMPTACLAAAVSGWLTQRRKRVLA